MIAGGAVRTVLEVAGVKNGYGKILNSGNAMNNAKATIKALSEMRTVKQIAETRGVSIDYLLGKTIDPKDSAWPPSDSESETEEDESIMEDPQTESDSIDEE